MNKIIFCDKNKELLAEVKKLFKGKTCNNNLHCELIVDNSGDILKCKKKYPEAKIVTASNPSFSMVGGLDLMIKNKYPEQCDSPREFKITKDLFFVISVNNNLKSTKEIIKRALLGVYFCSRKNDIILSGLGTGIGGLSIKDFIKELELFVNADFSEADFSGANFSRTNFSEANFSWANFSEADFSWANFSRTDFRWANFSVANFSRTNFSEANFSWANFSRTDFRWANFSRTDFRWANFSVADFSETNFRWTYFSRANFSRTNFSEANFRGANFSEADFSWANFSEADFSRANFSRTNFSEANFSRADFSRADFSRADFSRADFSGANFSEANFRGANFSSADFSGAYFNYRIAPEEGILIVWKKANNHIIKLEVDCKNISGGLVSRKLRTNKAIVLEIQEIDGTKSTLKKICSNYDKNFAYEVGKTVKVDNFIRDDKIECAVGIHFFLTRDEAVKWQQ